MTIPLSLYLHVPFCRARCSYCAFNVYVHQDKLIPAYVEALVREIRQVAATAPQRTVHTVYLGGGTPSMLTPAQLGEVLHAVGTSFDLAADAEITTEANPNDITEAAVLEAWRAAGINRLSLGMQSADEGELALFTRQHDADTVARAVAVARAAGFDNLSVDLIYGAPGQTLASWQHSVEAALAFDTEHVSLYGLELKEGTALRDWVEAGRVPQPDDDLAADMYDFITARLAEAGYEQYEISNWAKPGHASRHNLQYWRNWPYLGLGPGAHGWAGGVRYAVTRAPGKYIRAMGRAPQTPPAFPLSAAVDWQQPIDRDEEITDTLLMGLRLTQEGVRRAEFTAHFGEDVLAARPVLAQHARTGLVDVLPERVRLTERGRLLSNLVFRDLV